jgi:DNA repair protein RAD7
MSGRRNRNRAGAPVRGPHSALTDFLAANNISAADIRTNYQRRLAQAEQEAEQRRAANAENGGPTEGHDDDEEDPEEVLARIRQERKLNEKKEAMNRKKSKATKLAKDKMKKKMAKEKERAKAKAKAKAANGVGKKRKKDDDSDDLEDEDDDTDWSVSKDDSDKETSASDGASESSLSEIEKLPKKRKPLPGQFSNCEICEKRFTVTPYSKTGPHGGLLCTPCGKIQEKDTKKDAKKNQPKAPARKRRNLESERMDGIVRQGAKTLVEMCIEKVLKHHEDIESFDNMPEHLILQICRLFTKHRVMNETTLPLFLRGDMREVQIFDCACECI